MKNNDFKESIFWKGGDLQTIRDTFCIGLNSFKNLEKVFIPLPDYPSDLVINNYLLGYLEKPDLFNLNKGLILITHGLGGSTKRFGLKRISRKLLNEGFAVLKLNLRGAGSGRYLSHKNYSARCSNDIISVVNFIRKNLFPKDKYSHFERNNFPIYGIGLSLGGTILLNACFDFEEQNNKPLLDGLACVSSPLDLNSCSQCIDKPRNFIYQKWLINRLKSQVLQSQLNKIDCTKENLTKRSIKKIKTIREFDEKITAPNWGYKSVDDYYLRASPFSKIKRFFNKLPRSLFIHAKDDPWVPYEPTLELKNFLKDNYSGISFLLTEKGGHNGFHSSRGCWSDEIVSNWIKSLNIQ